MAELSIVNMFQCKSNEYWETEIKGHKVTFGRVFGGKYQFDFSCDCKGFHFRKKCSHIDEAREKWCGWHEQFDSGEVVDGKCPRCGGETMIVRVGV